MHYRKALGITTETELILEYTDNKMTISISEDICKICEKRLDRAFTDLPICNECVEKIKKTNR